MKKILTCLILVFTFTFINVKAKGIELNVDKKTVKENDEVIVSINFDEQKSYEAKLNYDRNIFKMIDSDSFVMNEDINLSYDKDTNTFSFVKPDTSTNIQIKLKVKNGVFKGKTNINVEYISSISDSNSLSSSKEITVDGIEPETEEESFFYNIKENHPYVSYSLIAISIAIIIFIIYFYNKNSKKELQNKQIIIMLLLGVLAIISFVPAIIILKSKSNRETLEEGSKDIIEYLIEAKEDSSNQSSESEDKKTFNVQLLDKQNTLKDSNKLTSNQETSKNSTKKPVEKIVYEASIASIDLDKEIIARDDELILTFALNIKPYANVKKVEINGVIYPVSKYGDKYQAKIKAPKNLETQKIAITGVILENGNKIKVNAESEVYVLKNNPTVKNFNINKRVEVPVITFDIDDEDESFISGKIIITSPKSDFKEEKEVNVGLNTIDDVLMEEGVEYNIQILLTYDLDDKSTDENKKQDIISYNSTFTFEREYAFKLKNPKLTEKVTDGEDLTLTFENGLYSYKDVEYIFIDGKKYDVEKSRDIYTVKNIDKCVKKGSCSIKLEKVILKDNAKEFDINEEKSYIYLKNEPNIVSVSANIKDSVVSGTFEITDNDSSVTNAIATLKDSEGNVILSDIKTTLNEKSGSFDGIKVSKAGDYTIEIELIYDLGDGELKNISKSSNSFNEPVKATIKDVMPEVDYIERKSNLNLIYTIESNTDQTLESIEINGQSYSLEKQDNGTYKVNVSVSKDTNEDEIFNTTKLVYTNGTVDLKDAKTALVHIFKLVPSNLSVTAQIIDSNITGSFDYTDSEDAAKSARIVLIDENGSEISEGVVDFDNKTFNGIKVSKAGNYTVKLYLTSDEVKEEFKVVTAVSETITEPVRVTINAVEEEKRYVEVSDKVNITYDVTANTDKKIESMKINGESYIPTYSEESHLYTIEFTIPSSESEEQEYGLEEVVFKDGKAIITENDKINVYVLKVRPSITELEVNYEPTSNNLTGKFSYTDPDLTVKSAKIYLKNSNGDVVYESPVDKDNKQFNLNIPSSNLSKAGEYTVLLELTYDLGDGNYNLEYDDTKKIEEPIKAVIKSIENEDYIERKGNLDILYTIEDNTDEALEFIKIGGIDYPAKEENGKYKISVEVQESYGNQEFLATDLIYINKKTTSLSEERSKTSVYVLKNAPTIQYAYSDIEKSTITLTINDSESTLVLPAYIVIKDSKGTEKKKQTITANLNEIDVSDLLPNGIYTIELEGKYDLDEENGNSKNEYQLNDLIDIEPQKIINNYDPQVTNLKAVSFGENNITLNFNSTNEGGNDLKKVKIDKVYYEVEKQENGSYNVTIPSDNERKEIKITDVMLDTLKELSLSKQASITVFLNEPTVTEFTATPQDNKKINSSFTINDSDNTTDGHDVYIYLKNSKGEVEGTREKIDNQTSTFNFDKILKAGKYKVAIEMKYNREDGKGEQTKVIETDDYVTINLNVNVTKALAQSHYVQKGGNLKFVYTVEANTDEKASTVTINDKIGDNNYNVTKCTLALEQPKEAEGIYVSECEAEYKGPTDYKTRYSSDKNYGVVELETTKITYQLDGEDLQNFDVSSKSEKIEVLKTRPYINFDSYVASGSYTDQTAQMSFIINDPDNAIVRREGDIIGVPVYASAISTDKIDKVGETVTVNFKNVPKDRTALFYISFDYNLNMENLDTNYFSDYNVNIQNGAALGRFAFTLIESHDLNIRNLKVIGIDGSLKTTFAKNEQVKLEFNANVKDDSLSDDGFEDFHIQYIIIKGKTYEVVKDGDKYTTIDYLDLSNFDEGSQNISVDRVILNNHEELLVMGTRVNVTITADSRISNSLSNSIIKGENVSLKEESKTIEKENNPKVNNTMSINEMYNKFTNFIDLKKLSNKVD